MNRTVLWGKIIITPVSRPHPKVCGTPGEATWSGEGEEKAGCTRLLLQVKPRWIGSIDGRVSSSALNSRAKAPLFDGLAFLLSRYWYAPSSPGRTPHTAARIYSSC